MGSWKGGHANRSSISVRVVRAWRSCAGVREIRCRCWEKSDQMARVVVGGMLTTPRLLARCCASAGPVLARRLPVAARSQTRWSGEPSAGCPFTSSRLLMARRWPGAGPVLVRHWPGAGLVPARAARMVLGRPARPPPSPGGGPVFAPVLSRCQPGARPAHAQCWAEHIFKGARPRPTRPGPPDAFRASRPRRAGPVRPT